jgi:hypothetical protein
MKKLTFSIVFLALSLPLTAQSWTSIGTFNKAPKAMYYDSVAQKFWLAGSYAWFDSTEIHGFGYLQGDTVIGVGLGFGHDTTTTLTYLEGTPRVNGICRFQGDLYATGEFNFAGGTRVNRIAKMGSNDWIPVGTGLSQRNNPNLGIGYGLKVMGNELYVFGYFDSINGIPANSLAKFDGTTWSSVFSLPRFTQNTMNVIYDVQWYQGELYIGGNFEILGTNPRTFGLAKWDGNNWVGVPPSFRENFALVTRLVVYDGKMVIAGQFDYNWNPNSIPGNGITAWDGANWDTLDGGIELGRIVHDVVVKGGELFISGNFQTAGNTNSSYIAKWDGHSWCSESSNPPFGPYELAFYHDTLFYSHYICGGLPMCLSKWVGGQFGDSCQMVGSPEPVDLAPDISIFPNPAHATFDFRLPPDVPVCSFRIYDVSGREVMPERVYQQGDPSVDIAFLSSGMYFVQIAVKNSNSTLKLIKQ